MESEDLFIVSISKLSPLEIVIASISVALTAAVIFSGGQIEIDASLLKIKGKLKSLGHGLKKIQEAVQMAEQNRLQIAQRKTLEVAKPDLALEPKADLNKEILALQTASMVPGIDETTIDMLNKEISIKRDQLKKGNQ